MSKLIRTVRDLQSYRAALAPELKVGVVPTMGNLHEGHASLVARSIKDNDVTIVTIFVNPKQFGPNEDFASYPRTLEDDQKIIDSLGGEVAIFAPASTSEIYPEGFATSISITGPLTEVLCGASRPGHFEGVTTVVYQLFALTKPHRAYFGQKDYQQLQVIKRMNTDLRLGVEIIPMPIARASDGLALSSRNQYLSSKERVDALELSKALEELRSTWSRDGQEAAELLRQEIVKSQNSWDYLEILDAQDLTPPKKSSKIILFAGARFFGRARLIDNLTLETTVAR